MNFFSFLKSSSNIKSQNAADFKSTIADKKIQLVDVRTADEFRRGTIEGAIQIDMYARDFEQLVDNKLDKSRPVAVFCVSGARSMRAAKILEKKGFSEVYNLKGGLLRWR